MAIKELGITQVLNKIYDSVNHRINIYGAVDVNPEAAGVATIRVSSTILTSSVLVIAANSNRKGLILYNNSANSVYLALGSAANSATNMTFILATFAHLVLPVPIYTGPIYGIRNAGSGTVLSTELT